MNRMHRYHHRAHGLVQRLAVVLALAGAGHLAHAASPMVEPAEPAAITAAADSTTVQGRDRPGDAAWLALAGVLAIIFMARRRRD